MIEGRPWKIIELDMADCGQCFHGSYVIVLDSKLSPRMRFATLIHELVHASSPRLTETQVRRIEDAVSDGLWKDGWRRKR